MNKFDDGQDRIEFLGTELVNTQKAGACWHCGASTVWMDIHFMAYLCSEECVIAKWGEYFEGKIRK